MTGSAIATHREQKGGGNCRRTWRAPNADLVRPSTWSLCLDGGVCVDRLSLCDKPHYRAVVYCSRPSAVFRAVYVALIYLGACYFTAATFPCPLFRRIGYNSGSRNVWHIAFRIYSASPVSICRSHTWKGRPTAVFILPTLRLLNYSDLNQCVLNKLGQQSFPLRP